MKGHETLRATAKRRAMVRRLENDYTTTLQNYKVYDDAKSKLHGTPAHFNSLHFKFHYTLHLI